MLASFVLSLREGLEAALVVSIVLGAAVRMGQKQLLPAIWRGVAAALVVILLAAVILSLVGAELEGRAEQIYEGIAMLLAAGMLTWMIFWMRRQAGAQKQTIEATVQRATGTNGQKAVFVLAFLAVVREGLELALFLFAAGAATNPIQAIAGASLGLAAASGLGWMLFTSTRRLGLKRFFLFTNILLVLFAAGLAAHSIGEFTEAGLIPAVVDHLWNTNAILNDQSALGSILRALFGYNGAPSLAEVVTYIGYFIVLALGFAYFRRQMTVSAR
jgi:high-affinity iron transporter